MGSDQRPHRTFLDELLLVLDKYRDLGEITHPNGTISIGKIPGKEKWFLIHLYAGLSPKEISRLEKSIGKALPSPLKKFYSILNGLSLFGAGQFGISGLRGSARHDMPNYQPTPFPPSHLDESMRDAVFFGGYFGAYEFYMTQESDTVYVCKRGGATPIEQWNDVESMVLDVATRLSAWFDENAQPVDPIVNEQPVLFEKSGSQ